MSTELPELNDHVVPVRITLTRTQVFHTFVHLNPVIPMHRDAEKLRESIVRQADDAARFEWTDIRDHIDYAVIDPEIEEMPGVDHVHVP